MRFPRTLLLLALGLSGLAAPVRAQAPSESEPPPPVEGTGSWSGGAKLSQDAAGVSCTWDVPAENAPLKLEISGTEAALSGSVALDLPAPAGSRCPALRKRWALSEIAVSEGALSFTDSAGHQWNLARRRDGGLRGLVSWQGGHSEPLASGFSVGGSTPGTQLSGEVRLTPLAEAPAAPASTAETPRKTSAGARLGHLGALLGANVAGAAVLVGVNKLGKGESSGVVSCSPRVCFFQVPGAPCYCPKGDILSGASCGDVAGGVEVNEPCDGATKPCQAGYSCNNNICQDRTGFCPYEN
jgi:hypothetical protein